jgi:hypothetical protein
MSATTTHAIAHAAAETGHGSSANPGVANPVITISFIALTSGPLDSQ